LFTQKAKLAGFQIGGSCLHSLNSKSV